MGVKGKRKKPKQAKSTKVSRRDKAAAKRRATESIKGGANKRVLNRPKKKRKGKHSKNKRKGE
jgi:hypothetical protein